MKLILQGQDVTAFAGGLEDISVTYLLSPRDRSVGYGVSTSVTLTGAPAARARELITDLTKTLTAVLEIENLPALEFVLTARHVKDCGCDVEVLLQTSPEDRAKYERLVKKILSDDGAIIKLAASGHISKNGYCYEPNFVTYVLIVMYQLLRLVIDAIVFVISVFDDNHSVNSFRNYVKGCSKYHFTWNVWGTVKLWADWAGLAWSSSILTGDQRSLHFLDASNFEGLSRRDVSKGLLDTEYVVNYTVFQFLDALSQVFNADYRIINGVLVFERVDWFAQNAVEIRGEILEEPCYEADPSQLYTNIKFEYSADPMDETSAVVQAAYSGRQDHNPLEIETLRGTKTVNPPVAMSRWVSDRFGDRFIRQQRQVITFGSWTTHDLVLARGQTGVLRIFNLTKTTNQESGVPDLVQFDPGPFLYQEKLYFKRVKGNGNSQTYNSLYDRYWFIEDPVKHPRYYTQEIVMRPADICDALRAIEDNNLNVFIQTPYGRAVPKEIDIDLKTGIFTFKDLTIWP